ncbi:MAG: twin-arginine translocase subunit TatC [Rhodobacteraceae bacterium]|nr:twin-arginine translocase subunit TatC [Paracoccaceae bacterium]
MSEDIDATKAPLIEHLTELRTRLIRSVLAFIVGMVICFTVWEPIFHFLTDPICQALDDREQQCGLILIKLQEGFFVAVRISVMGGLMLSFPYIAFQLWRFVAPGLYKTEKRAFLPFMIASPFMFMLGAAFAFFVVIPLAFNFFLGFQQEAGFLDGAVESAPVASQEAPTASGSDSAQQGADTGTGNAVVSGAPPTVPEESAGDVAAGDDSSFGWLSLPGGSLPAAGVTFQGSVAEYLTLTIKFILAFGLCFQLPVLLTLMGKAGLVTASGLARVRKYAVVGILVLAAVVTPPDVITQVILFVVVYGLYEISIWLVRRVEARLKARLKEQGLDFESDESEEGSGKKDDGKVSA